MTRHEKSEINVGDSERTFSLLGGGMAMYLAFTRPTAAKLPLAAGGAYLLYRGLAGKAPVYELLNIQRSPWSGDHLFVRRAVTVNRPRADVFAFWRNFENLPRFVQYLQEVRVSAGGHGPDVCIEAVGMEADSGGLEGAYDRIKSSLRLETDRHDALVIIACGRSSGTNDE